MAESLWGFRDESRRIGRRTPVGGSAVLWVPHGRRRNKTKPVPVEISNVSVSGLGFFTDHTVLLRIGQLLMFEIVGVTSLVRVRRSADIEHGSRTYYGVEFTESDPAVLPFIQQRLTDRRSRVALNVHGPLGAGDVVPIPPARA